MQHADQQHTNAAVKYQNDFFPTAESALHAETASWLLAKAVVLANKHSYRAATPHASTVADQSHHHWHGIKQYAAHVETTDAEQAVDTTAAPLLLAEEGKDCVASYVTLNVKKREIEVFQLTCIRKTPQT